MKKLLLLAAAFAATVLGGIAPQPARAQAVYNIFSYPLTAQESTAGVTKSQLLDSRYVQGDLRRYGGCPGCSTSQNNTAIAVAASVGGDVYFSPGTWAYSVEPRFYVNGTHIHGAGDGATILQPTGWIDCLLVADSHYPGAVSQIENVEIDHLTCDNSAQSAGSSDTFGNGININAGDKFNVHDNIVSAKQQELVSTFYGPAISLPAETSGSFHDNLVILGPTNNIGIGAEGESQNVTIQNNTIVMGSNTGPAIWAGNQGEGGSTFVGAFLITGNNIYGTNVSNQLGIWMVAQAYQNSILANKIRNVDIGIRASVFTGSDHVQNGLIAANDIEGFTTFAIATYPAQTGDSMNYTVSGNRAFTTVASGSARGIIVDKATYVFGNTLTMNQGLTGIYAANGASWIENNHVVGATASIDTSSSSATGSVLVNNDVDVLPTNGSGVYEDSVWNGTHIFYGNGTNYPITIIGNAGTLGLILSSPSGIAAGLALNQNGISEWDILNEPTTGRLDFNKGGSTHLWMDNGLVVGGATGGDEGLGSLNAQALYVNGTAVSTAVGANPTASVGLTAVNGSATTWMRSDAAPALSQSIAPTWTGIHTFSTKPIFSGISGLVVGNDASQISQYAGTSCTNQFPRSLSAFGVATCASVANTDLVNSSITINGTSVSLGGTRTLTLASADFANQGTTTTLLHGNASGNPSFGAVSLTNDITGTLGETHGGTNQSSYTLGDILYASATNALSKLAGNTSSTKQFLTQTGTGSVSAAPTWGAIAAGDLPANGANPSASVGLSAVNGSATTWMRSDAAPALSQSIAPTWTGQHIFAKTGAIPLIVEPDSSHSGIDITVSSGNFAILQLDQSGVSSWYTKNVQTSGNYSIETSGGTQAFVATTAGAVALPSISSSTAAQTGTLCWSVSAVTYDPSLGCLTSSQRFKENILPLDAGLSEVMKMRAVSYDIRPEFNPTHLGRQVGMIAEEVAQIDKRLIGYEPDGVTPRGIRYAQLTAVLVNSIQEQQRQIYTLYALLALVGMYAIGASFIRLKR